MEDEEFRIRFDDDLMGYWVDSGTDFSERFDKINTGSNEQQCLLPFDMGLLFLMLPSRLDNEVIAELQEKRATGQHWRTKLTQVEFRNQLFYVYRVTTGDGVAYTQIGVYAEEDNGEFRYVAMADSRNVHRIVPEITRAGILELREKGNLEGNIILSCNLNRIGTWTSIKGMRD